MKPRFRRTRGYIIGGLLFAILLILFVVKGDIFLKDMLSHQDVLPVRAVEIDGALQQLTKKQIADITGRICAGQNIASLDLSVLQKTLEAEPWVAQVMVSKKMPDTLVISLVEHVPAAFWNEIGFYDAKTASVFYPKDGNYQANLVHLGAERDNLAPEVYAAAVQFIRMMEGKRSYQMYSLYLDKVHSYTLTLNNKIRTRLILGQYKDARTRLDRFLKAFEQTGLNINQVPYVDLRYDVGFAVGKIENSREDNHESVPKKLR